MDGDTDFSLLFAYILLKTKFMRKYVLYKNFQLFVVLALHKIMGSKEIGNDKFVPALN
jgi:hypothetical protein